MRETTTKQASFFENHRNTSVNATIKACTFLALQKEESMKPKTKEKKGRIQMTLFLWVAVRRLYRANQCSKKTN